MSLVLDGTNGISGCPAVGSAGGNVPPILGDNAGNTATCRAWAHFNGSTSIPTIQGSFNVSSITKSGTGIYLVNLLSVLPDQNGCILVAGGSDTAGTTTTQSFVSTSQVKVESYSSGYVDQTQACVAIFR